MPIRPEYYLLGGGGGAAGELAFQLGEDDPPVFVQVFSASTMEEAREARDEHARDPANTPWLDQYRVDEETRQINKVLVLEDTTEGRFLLCAWDEQTPEYSAALASGNAVRTLLDGIGLTGGDDPDLGRYYYRFTARFTATGGLTKTEIDSIKAAIDGFLTRDDRHNPPFFQFGAAGSETRQRIYGIQTYPHRTSKSIWGPSGTGATFDGFTIGAKPAAHSRFDVAADTVSIPDGGGGADVARIRNTVNAFNSVPDSHPWTFTFDDTNGTPRAYNIRSMEAFIFPGEFWTYRIVLETNGVDIPSQTPTTWDILARQPDPGGWRFQLDMGPTGVLPSPQVLAAGDWSIVDRDLTHSWIESGGADGGEGFRKGPEQNLFSATDLATAKAARDTYALDADNADWLREYKNNRLLYFLLLEDETAKQITVEAYDKEVHLYTSQFGTGTPPNQLADKPDTANLQGLRGSEGGNGRRYRLRRGATTCTDMDAWKNAANAAFDRGDPWYIEDSSGAENVYIPFAAHVTTSNTRTRQSIWNETWDDDDCMRRQVVAEPTAISGVTHIVRRADFSTGVAVEYLSITVGTGAVAQNHANAIVHAYGDTESRPWILSYTDSLGTAISNVRIERDGRVTRDTFDVTTTPDPSSPGTTVTTTYQRVNFRLPASGTGSAGAVTNLSITAVIPNNWLLDVPIGDYDGTTPPNIANRNWDFMDRNIRHDWISIGAGGAVAGLSQTEVDARVRALVNRVALAGNTAEWDESKIPDPDVAFVDLTDGPGDIEAGKYVAGNADGDALEFVDAPTGGGGGGGGLEESTAGDKTFTKDEIKALNGKTLVWTGAGDATFTFQGLDAGETSFFMVSNRSATHSISASSLTVSYGSSTFVINLNENVLFSISGGTIETSTFTVGEAIIGLQLSGTDLFVTTLDTDVDKIDLSSLAGGGGSSGTVFLDVSSNQTIASTTSAGWNEKIVVVRGFTSPVTLSFPGSTLGPSTATTFLIENRGGANLELQWGTSSPVTVKTGEGALMQWGGGPAWTITVFSDREGSGGAASTTFAALTDTPNSFSGQGGKHVAVNSAADALEFVDAPSGGGGGSSTFAALTDTPSAFTGQGGKHVAVNAAADALEFVDAPAGEANVQADFGEQDPSEDSFVLNRPGDGDRVRGDFIAEYQHAASTPSLGEWQWVSATSIRINENEAAAVAKLRASKHVWINEQSSDGHHRRTPISVTGGTNDLYTLTLSDVSLESTLEDTLEIYEDDQFVTKAGIPENLTDLDDFTPTTLTGQGGKHLAVNTAGNAVVLVDAPTGGGGGLNQAAVDARIATYARATPSGKMAVAQLPALTADLIPDLDADKIKTGTLAVGRIPDLAASKITGTLAAGQIPSLNANKINAGEFAAARIPSLPFSKLTGEIADSQIPSGVTRDTELNNFFKSVSITGRVITFTQNDDTTDQQITIPTTSGSATGLTEAEVKALIENFAEVGATGTVPLTRFGDGVITEAKLAAAVTNKLNDRGQRSIFLGAGQTYDKAATKALDDHTIYYYGQADAAVSLAALDAADSVQIIVWNVGQDTDTDVSVTALAADAANNLSNYRIRQSNITVFRWSSDRWAAVTVQFHQMLIRAAWNNNRLELGTREDSDAWPIAIPGRAHYADDSPAWSPNAATVGNWYDGVVVWTGSAATTLTLPTGLGATARTFLLLHRGTGNITHGSVTIRPGEDARMDWSGTAWSASRFEDREGSGGGLSESQALALIATYARASNPTGQMAAAQVPNLDASKINAGTFAPARIPDLDASKINAGTFNAGRIPDLPFTKITGTISDGQIPSSIARDSEIATYARATSPTGKMGVAQLPTLTAALIPSLPVTKITGMPDYPATGSRNDKVLKFDGDALGWEADAVGTAGSGEENVQADWTETDTASDAFIKNKPTLAPSTAEENVQADWTESSAGSDAYIKNKPTLLSQGDVDARIATYARISPTGKMAVAQLPALTADLIPDLNASKINAGTLADARIPSTITRDTELATELANLFKSVAISGNTVTFTQNDDTTDQKFDLPDQVQSDWNEATDTSAAYIKNKPTVLHAADGDPMRGPLLRTYALDSGSGPDPADDGQYKRASATVAHVKEEDDDQVALLKAATHLWLGAIRYPVSVADRAAGDTYAVTFTGATVPTSGSLSIYRDSTAVSRQTVIDLRGDPVVTITIQANDLVYITRTGRRITRDLPAAGSSVNDNLQLSSIGNASGEDHVDLDRSHMTRLNKQFVLWGGSADAEWRFADVVTHVFFFVRNVTSHTLTLSYNGGTTTALEQFDSALVEWVTNDWVVTKIARLAAPPEKASDDEALAGVDDTKYMTPADVKAAIAQALAPPPAAANDVYWGALSGDPTSITQTPALQTDDIPSSGSQTLTITRMWSGRLHMYIIQLAADDNISAFTIDGLPSRGWTRGTFSEGGTDYEYWKSRDAWNSAPSQNVRIGVTR